MSKILILTNSITGLRSFRIEVMKKFRDEGHDVAIYCPEHEETEEFTEIGCKVSFVKNIQRRGTSVFTDVKLFFEYLKILLRERPDMVFTYTIKPNIYGAMACAVLGIPCVPNITGLGSAVENGGKMQLLTVFLYKLGFIRVKKVFFQNKENMDFFVKKKIARGKHELLPGSGVNLERFGLMPYPEKDTVEFAFISRIMKEKGADQYFEAAEYIKEKYPNTVFHVCGSCEEAYQEKLRQLHEKGIINYHGRLRDIREIHKEIHCTIHPTYYPEGMSNVLLESCASGRAIITTDRSGCREIVDDGVNGYIVKQKNTQDVIEKIEKFLALSFEERKEMGLRGRKKVEKEFDRNIVIDKYMTELGRLAK